MAKLISSEDKASFSEAFLKTILKEYDIRVAYVLASRAFGADDVVMKTLGELLDKEIDNVE